MFRGMLLAKNSDVAIRPGEIFSTRVRASTTGGQFVTICQAHTPRKRARAGEMSSKPYRLGVCLGFDLVLPSFCPFSGSEPFTFLPVDQCWAKFWCS